MVDDPQAPLLLFPTHYLGNFILGLPWVASVLRKHPGAPVVLDAQFEALARLVLADDANLLLYPRKQLSKGERFSRRLACYWRFIRALRRHRRRTLLDLEGERFTGVLAWLSGCSRRVGPTGKRAETFYTDVRQLNYRNHRFNAFGEIVAGFTDGKRPASGFDFAIDADSHATVTRLLRQCDPHRPLVAIHPGASVSYKLWPRAHFVELGKWLTARGCQLAWVGAGAMDMDIIEDISARLGSGDSVNLCNRLGFVQLAALYSRCTLFIGGDSGPMHLAAAAGLPVFALFGPSDEAIWAPLGDNAHLLRSLEPCGDNCNARRCDHGYRCMQTLQPSAIIARLQDQLPKLKPAPAPVPVRPVTVSAPSLPVSVYIITRNEAANIGACLDRLVEFDEVILVDSGSTDGTVEIAGQYANVSTSFHAWCGFSAQKSHALGLCRNQWVLNVDADEILSDAYLDEVRRVVRENRVDALESARVLRRWGVEPRSFDKTDRLIRLFRKSAGSYRPRRVHEFISIDGIVEKTAAVIEHHENLSYTERVDKANRYAQARAEDKLEEGARTSIMVLMLVFPVSFVQSYVLKGNLLDGVDGLLSSMNTAWYKFVKYARLWELEKRRHRK